jgi:hypothetical protein
VISNDHYQPVPEIVRVGAKPRPVVRPAKPVSPGTLPTNSPAPIGPVPNPKRALQGRP